MYESLVPTPPPNPRIHYSPNYTFFYFRGCRFNVVRTQNKRFAWQAIHGISGWFDVQCTLENPKNENPDFLELLKKAVLELS
jgi:hypothetical protein